MVKRSDSLFGMTRGSSGRQVRFDALVLVVAAFAWPVSAWATCASPSAGHLPTPLVEWHAKYPNGGGALVSDVRNLAATTTDSLAAIIAFAKDANSEQKRAVGAGLGQAAAICARPDPSMARTISEAILVLDSKDVSIAYQAATGDRQTGAISGGAGGAGGVGGGLGGGGTLASSGTAGSSSLYAPSTITVLNLVQTYKATALSVLFSGNSTNASSPSTSVSQSR